jgi:hypothetical protein
LELLLILGKWGGGALEENAKCERLLLRRPEEDCPITEFGYCRFLLSLGTSEGKCRLEELAVPTLRAAPRMPGLPFLSSL